MYGSYKQLLRYQEDGRAVRVAKYTRCSSDEQKKNGYTIGDQLSLLDEFCTENELVSAGTYVDEGISATLEINKRKALANLIKDAKAGKFDIVIFKCIDRFFRNVGEYYECQKQLRAAGVTWISIEESDLDPEDDDAAFKINIYLTMAEYEARKTSKRIMFNNKMRIKNKQVVTSAFHFPWIVVGEARNRRLAKDETKAELLYDLLDYFETHQTKAGTIGYINIKYGMRMNTNTLTSILSDTLLYGEYKGVSGYVEPYITKERYDKIQDIMKRNSRVWSNAPKRAFLFSGLIKCPGCGLNLTGNYTKTHGKYENISYRCNAYRTRKVCDYSKCLTEHKLEKQLLDNLEQYINNDIAKVEGVQDNQPENKNAVKVEKLKTEMERLNTMFRKGRIDEEEYDKEYLKLEKKLKTLEVDEAPAERNLDTLKGILSTDYKGLYEQLTKENKKAFWRGLIKQFSIDDDRKIDPDSIVFF